MVGVRGRRAHNSALVHNIKFEAPSLIAHQYTAKLVPADLATIDNQKRELTVMSIVPLNSATNDSMIPRFSVHVRCQ